MRRDACESAAPSKDEQARAAIVPLVLAWRCGLADQARLRFILSERSKGRAFLVRYADDFVRGFAGAADARRVPEVLPKRLGKYGLTIHPDKTRLGPFVRPPPPPSSARRGAVPPKSFDFLGFTHFWSRSQSGSGVVKRQTAGSRFRRAVGKIAAWCRLHRPESLGEQSQAWWRQLRGHFPYYGGLVGNGRPLWCFRSRVQEIWRQWLCRRGGARGMPWARMAEPRKRFGLPPPPGWVSPCVVQP